MKRFFSLFVIFLLATSAQAADVGQLELKAFPTESISASWTTHTLDGSTDALEVIFQAEEAGAITDLCYRYGIRTGTPPTYQISLQGVNASTGRADGTIKSSTNAKITFTPPASTAEDNTVQCKTLTSSYTATKGEFLAIVIGYSSGTISGAHNGTFAYQNGNAIGMSFPFSWTVDAGSGTRRAGFVPYGYKISSTYYGPLFQTTSLLDFGSGSSPDERGNIFTIPSGSCTSFKIDGARFSGYVNTTGTTLTAVVYEGTTVRQTVDMDTDILGSNTGSQTWLEARWSEGYTFSCGTAYRVVLKPSAAGGTTTGLWIADFSTAGALNSFPLGASMYYTGRTDAGAFSETTTRLANINLLISDITATAASGGQKSGTNGGLN